MYWWVVKMFISIYPLVLQTLRTTGLERFYNVSYPVNNDQMSTTTSILGSRGWSFYTGYTPTHAKTYVMSSQNHSLFIFWSVVAVFKFLIQSICINLYNKIWCFSFLTYKLLTTTSTTKVFLIFTFIEFNRTRAMLWLILLILSHYLKRSLFFRNDCDQKNLKKISTLKSNKIMLKQVRNLKLWQFFQTKHFFWFYLRHISELYK